MDHSQGGRSFGSAGSGCMTVGLALSGHVLLLTTGFITLYRSGMTIVVLQLLFMQQNHRV